RVERRLRTQHAETRIEAGSVVRNDQRAGQNTLEPVRTTNRYVTTPDEAIGTRTYVDAVHEHHVDAGSRRYRYRVAVAVTERRIRRTHIDTRTICYTTRPQYTVDVHVHRNRIGGLRIDHPALHEHRQRAGIDVDPIDITEGRIARPVIAFDRFVRDDDDPEHDGDESEKSKELRQAAPRSRHARMAITISVPARGNQERCEVRGVVDCVQRKDRVGDATGLAIADAGELDVGHEFLEHFGSSDGALGCPPIDLLTVAQLAARLRAHDHLTGIGVRIATQRVVAIGDTCREVEHTCVAESVVTQLVQRESTMHQRRGDNERQAELGFIVGLWPELALTRLTDHRYDVAMDEARDGVDIVGLQR